MAPSPARSLPRRFYEDRRLRLAIGAALSVVALLVLVSWVTLFRSDPRGFWSEWAKVGMQSVVVGLIGVILTGALNAAERDRADALQHELAAQAAALQRELDAQADRRHAHALAREDARRRTEYRLDLLHRLRSAYSDVKRARRELEAAGFDASDSDPFSSRAEDVYVAAMAKLGDANLELEAIEEELEPGLGPGPATDEIKRRVTTMEQYLGHYVLREYRRNRQIQLAGGGGLTNGRFRELHGFASGKDFGPLLSEPFHVAVCVLVADTITPDAGSNTLSECLKPRTSAAEGPPG